MFTNRARKDILSLEKQAARRILKKLEEAAKNPGKFKKLSGCPYHKLRAGDYRAIATIDTQNQKIEIRRIGHRKNIYEKM